MLDQRDRHQTALGIADDERLARIGAKIDLAGDHLLHGEIAGRHGELLEGEAVLLQIAGFQQIVGGHAPDVGLVALPDGFKGCGAPRQAKPKRQSACTGQREALPPRN
jgi:hypothetical protein